VKASHDILVELFERIESFFRRLALYTQVSFTTQMAEVLVKIVTEVLCILSIATKEVKRNRMSESFPHICFTLTIPTLDQIYISGACWERKMLKRH
jgi:hypothetical protein